MMERLIKLRNTLDTFILASKKFHTFWFSRLIILMLATLVSLQYNIYGKIVKLASFKISYLK